MNTANITRNTGVSSRYNTRKEPKARTFFGDSPQKPNLVEKPVGNSKNSRLVTTGVNQVMGTGKENVQPNTHSAKKDSVADNSPFKTLAGSVYGGQGHAARGIFTPSVDSVLFSSETIPFLQGLPTTSSELASCSVRIASLNEEFHEDYRYSSDSETSVASGITYSMSTSSSDNDFFRLSDSDESRDSFLSNGASKNSAEVGDFNEKEMDFLPDFGFNFDGI